MPSSAPTQLQLGAELVLVPIPPVPARPADQRSSMETASINFIVKKEEYTLTFVFLEFITRNFENFKSCKEFQKSFQNVPNVGRREGVPGEANVSQYWMSQIA